MRRAFLPLVTAGCGIAGCGTPKGAPDALGTLDTDVDACAPATPNRVPTPVRVTVQGGDATFHTSITALGEALVEGVNERLAVHVWGVCWKRPPRTDTDVEILRACAYFTVDERTEIDLHFQWPTPGADAVATIVGADTASLTNYGFGFVTSFYSPWGVALGAKGTIPPSGTVPTDTNGPEDLVLVGDAGDGTFPVVVARNLVVGDGATHFTVQPDDVQPLRTATLSVPSNMTVSQHLITANGTAIELPSSATTRFGLPANVEIEGDRYVVEMQSSDSHFRKSFTTLDAAVLQPQPIPPITGFIGEHDVENGVDTLTISWDVHPTAVGYELDVRAPRYLSITSIWDRTEFYFSSGVATPPEGCKFKFKERFAVAPGARTDGSLRALTSSAGSSDFPFDQDEPLRGFGPATTW